MITLKKNLPYLTVSFTIIHSLSGSMRSLHSELQPNRSLAARPLRSVPALSCSRGRRRSRFLAGFPVRYLVLEHHAEELSSQPVGQPRVFDDGHLEALAAEHGVVVGVNGSAHSLDDHQVGLALPHHPGQHFVQSAGRTTKTQN